MFWIIIGVLAGSYGPVDRAEAMSWRSNGIKKVLLLLFLKKKRYIIMPTKQQVELLRMFEIRVAKKNCIQ